MGGVNIESGKEALMVGIIILNYNGWELTKQCIESILRHFKGPYRIYLVDNASSIVMPEGYKDILHNHNVKLIEGKMNRGYSAGNNLGIKAALKDGCSHILISNNDILFTQDILEELLNFFEQNKKAGIAAPKVMLKDGVPQQVQLRCKLTLGGKYLNILRKTPLKFLSKRFVNDFYYTGNDKEPIKVYMVSGCCFMVSKECIRKIGYFDENTFLYEEENIMGCKMEREDFASYILPNITVLHLHGQSTEKMKAFSFVCMIESEIYYCRQYLRCHKWSVLPLIMIRVCEFLVKAVSDDDYKKNISDMFSKVWKEMKRNRA